MSRGQMRLRYVGEAHFGRSEKTNFLDPDVVPVAVRKQLKGNDVVALVSRTGNQMVFVYRPDHVHESECVTSMRVRLGSGNWNPLMLSEYAKQAGISLLGLKKFADYLRE